MKRPKTWQEYVALADHFLAIGNDEIYLSDGEDEPMGKFPWEYTTSIEKGGTFRYGVDVSKWFRATHPCGLRFRWCIDLEKRGSNGAATLQFNTSKLRLVKALLPPKLQREYADSLATAREQLRKQADEYTTMADRLQADARALEL